MAQIAIIGAGIGGVPCAFELRSKLGDEHRRKVRTGSVTPVYEKYVLKALGIVPLKVAR